MPTKQDETPKPAPGFEASLDDLEKVTKELESGELPLERALDLFEQGMKLSEKCRKQLEEAETRVEILLKKNDQVAPEPFQPDKA
jgi:exodeoxyribonuclease VII small subunit